MMDHDPSSGPSIEANGAEDADRFRKRMEMEQVRTDAYTRLDPVLIHRRCKTFSNGSS